MNGAGQDLFLVFENGFHHLRGRSGWSVISAASLQIFHDLGAAIARALDDGVKPVFRNQLCDRDTRDGGVSRQRDHSVTMAAEHERRNVLHTYVQFLCDKSAEARRVKE